MNQWILTFVLSMFIAPVAMGQTSSQTPVNGGLDERRYTAACLAELQNTPQAKSLSSKLLLDTSKPYSLELLANTSKPTPKEKASLSFVASELERCEDLSNEWRKRNLPFEVNALFESYKVDIKSSFVELYGGSLTYGDFAKARSRLSAEFKQRLNAIVANFQARAAENARRQQEAETQRRTAEAQAQAQAQRDRDLHIQRQQVVQQQLQLEERRLRLEQEKADQAYWQENVRQWQANDRQMSDAFRIFQQPTQVVTPPSTSTRCQTRRNAYGLETVCD